MLASICGVGQVEGPHHTKTLLTSLKNRARGSKSSKTRFLRQTLVKNVLDDNKRPQAEGWAFSNSQGSGFHFFPPSLQKTGPVLTTK